MTLSRFRISAMVVVLAAVWEHVSAHSHTLGNSVRIALEAKFAPTFFAVLIYLVLRASCPC